MVQPAPEDSTERAVTRDTDSRLRGLARRLEIDRAVFFAVLARIWQLLTGPVTAVFIVFFLTDSQQGYYYAFSSLLAAQILVELGLHVVLINFTSHEWSNLRYEDGEIKGDADALSRLVSLGRRAAVWYAVASVIFFAAVTPAGTWFFSDASRRAVQEGNAVTWFLPWFCLVALTGCQMLLLPLTAVLEGSGQLATINRVRFATACAGTAVVWLALLAGLGLWALACSAAVRLAGEAWLVFGAYGSFFRVFRKRPAGPVVDWRREVLPLQWRMAIQGPLYYLATHLAVPVVLKFHSDTEAGRLGMTWTILTALQAASLSWVETRRPLFGTLIAKREFAELDRRFFRLAAFSIGLITIGAILFVGGVVVVNHWSNWFFDRFASRLLPPLPAALLGLAMILMQFAQCTNLYTRAHNRDPFLGAAIISSLTVGGLVLWLGIRQGSLGVSIGYLAGVGAVQVPLWLWIWSNTRKEWHADLVVASADEQLDR